MSKIPLHRKAHQEDNVDSWLMSYADMITLLLAFFIIFVATSVPKQDKFAAATRGMKERFGTLTLESPFDDTYRAMVGIVATNHADRNIAIEKTARGMQMEMSSLSLFAPGSAEVPPSQLPLLKNLAETLKGGALAGYTIEVDGYTSDEAPPKGAFASNWELAAARATRVLRVLAEAGLDPAELRATSYGPSHPLVPNADAKGQPIFENRARNERVVIRVEKEQ